MVCDGDSRVQLMFHNLMCVKRWFRFAMEVACAAVEFRMIAANGRRRNTSWVQRLNRTGREPLTFCVWSMLSPTAGFCRTNHIWVIHAWPYVCPCGISANTSIGGLCRTHRMGMERTAYSCVLHSHGAWVRPFGGISCRIARIHMVFHRYLREERWRWTIRCNTQCK